MLDSDFFGILFGLVVSLQLFMTQIKDTKNLSIYIHSCHYNGKRKHDLLYNETVNHSIIIDTNCKTLCKLFSNEIVTRFITELVAQNNE